MLRRLVIPGAILALLAAFAVTLVDGDERKTLTATFPRTVSLYEGSDVRVLGVPIGTVDSVTPAGTGVAVTMSYDASVDVPADAEAVIISPSVVGDRFVQLTPAHTGGPVLEDGAELDESRTSTPLELDEIYGSIDQLTVALGPDGANKDGALRDLLHSTATNWAGQGRQFHRTIGDIGDLTGTLEDNKEELFGSARRLHGFIETLADNDDTVRRFNQSMDQVTRLLADERDELSASLRNLAVAMGEVSTFVKENRRSLGDNISGLNKVSRILVKQRAALDEILRVAPLALSNLSLTYNPQAGTLDTRGNLNELGTEVTSDPALFLCGLVGQADTSGEVCDAIRVAFPRPAVGDRAAGPRSGPTYDPTLAGLVEVSR